MALTVNRHDEEGKLRLAYDGRRELPAVRQNGEASTAYKMSMTIRDRACPSADITNGGTLRGGVKATVSLTPRRSAGGSARGLRYSHRLEFLRDVLSTTGLLRQQR